MEKNTEKKALCVSNGSINQPLRLRDLLVRRYGFDSSYFVAAADGGARNCLSMNIFPDIIIGDLDSINAGVLSILNNRADSPAKFISHKKNKDECDTQLAVDYLINSGFEKILITGVFGDRADHSFANILLLANPAYLGRDLKIITLNSEIFVTDKSMEITGHPGKRISLFSLSPFTYFKKTEGLKFSLKNEKLLFSPVRGISNEFTSQTAKIEITGGMILVILQL